MDNKVVLLSRKSIASLDIGETVFKKETRGE
jgi:hypothetical protein